MSLPPKLAAKALELRARLIDRPRVAEALADDAERKILLEQLRERIELGIAPAHAPHSASMSAHHHRTSAIRSSWAGPVRPAE